jgi:prophage tail gpP-like protein
MFADLTAFLPPSPLGQTEIVSVLVGGTRYTAFIRAQVRASYKEAARAFTLSIAAETGASATNAIFHAGAEVEVYLTDDLVLRGYVDQKEPHLGPREATIRVTGRSKSADLIDGIANHLTGFFEKKNPQEIGAELAKEYGTTFKTDQRLKTIDPSYLVTPGGSIFREVEKLTRRQGMTMTGLADGDVMITKPNGDRHGGGLIEGQNIIVINANHNWSNRYSKYSFKGQRPVGSGARRLHMVATAKDTAVSRHRVKVGIYDDDGDITDLKMLAESHRNRSAGEALKASVSVQGFRDEAGAVWQPGKLIWTESPYADIAQDMLIEAADFSQGPEGSITLLSLVDPRAYGGAGAGGGKGNKSGPESNIDASPAMDETPGP